MGRTKNSRPTKRSRSDNDWKQQRRERGDDTTVVIPADASNKTLQFMTELATRFESTTLLQDMHQEYTPKASEESKEVDSNGWYQGFRIITGKRYEIKVLGQFMVATFGQAPLQELVGYATAQAKLDESVKEMQKFSEWSLIVSLPNCEAQSIHIDVPANNVQFGLVFQQGVPGTLVLQKENHGPYSVSELLKLWADAPTSLQESLQSDAVIEGRVLKILSAYGPLLNPRQDLESNMVGAESLTTPNELYCGDLICTSGGVPHAGPACLDRVRVVMFASASASARDLYNVDDQYFAHSALLFILQVVWDSVDDASKSWLLLKLAVVVEEYDTQLIANHGYVSALMTDFMNQSVGKKEGALGRIVSDFIKQHGAKQERDIFEYRPPGVFE